MTEHIVPLSDGSSIKVDAPSEQAAREAAKNYLMRQGKPGVSLAKPVAQPPPDSGIARATEAGKAGGLDNWLRSFISIPTLAAIDEAKAGVQSAMPGVIDFLNRDLFTGEVKNPVPRGPNAYDTILGEDRAQSKAYGEEFPWWDASAKLAGGVTGLSMVKQVPVAGPLITGSSPSLVGGTVRSAVTGAGLSGVEGFGAGEGDFDQRANTAGKHGITGGVGGAVLHPLVAGGGSLVNAVVEGPLGRVLADRVAGPSVRLMGGVVDRVAPKVTPTSLSAAAPHGGPPVAADSVLGRVSEAMTGAAPSSESILNNAAAQRIATALRRGGDTTASGQQTLLNLGPGAMVADINPMTQRQLYTVTNTPGGAAKVANPALDTRGRETGDRVIGSVDEAMGNNRAAVLELERLKALRSGEGRTNYEEAVGPNAKYVISPEMRQIMQEAPAIQRAMDDIMANAADKGITLTPAQVAHRVKRQLALEAEAAFRSGKPVDKTDTGGLADRWRTALHKANPEIKAADEAWEAGSKRIDALELGRTFMRQGSKQGGTEAADAVSPEVLADRIPKMSQEEAQAFIAGAADTMKSVAGQGQNQARSLMRDVEGNNPLRQKLELMIGKDKADILYRRAMSEKTFVETNTIARGGSSTMRNVAAMADEAVQNMPSGGIPSTPQGALVAAWQGVAKWINKHAAGNEQVRERMAKMLTEMDPAEQKKFMQMVDQQLARQKAGSPLQSAVVPSLSGQAE